MLFRVLSLAVLALATVALVTFAASVYLLVPFMHENIGAWGVLVPLAQLGIVTTYLRFSKVSA